MEGDVSPAAVQGVGPRRLLAFDTSGEEAVVALGDDDGELLVQDRWAAGHVHGERLLVSIGRLLDDAGTTLEEVGAIAVGLGPGSFTGLRVGLAVGKGLAFGLGIPMVGIPTPVAFAAVLAAQGLASPADVVVVLQPAGPSGRYRSLVRIAAMDQSELVEAPLFLSGEDLPEAPAGAQTLAIDLPDATADAQAAGEIARAGLAVTLLRLARARLTTRIGDDSATLEPTYVTLPRGIGGVAGEIQWSHDRP